MILKIFSPKKIAKKWTFLTHNKAKVGIQKFLIISVVFEKTPIFSPKIGKNSRKLWS
jgi:hypothetical protein